MDDLSQKVDNFIEVQLKGDVTEKAKLLRCTYIANLTSADRSLQSLKFHLE